MKCYRCGKSFNECKALHPIDPPGTQGRRWVCTDCETKAEADRIDPVVKQIEDIILADNDEIGKE